MRRAKSCLDRVRALAEEGVTFLLATHDPAVMAMADERFELEHGRARGMASSAGPATEGRSGARSGGPTRVSPRGCSIRSPCCGCAASTRRTVRGTRPCRRSAA